MNYELYEVGGRVRDKFLGVKSNDVDYSVVIDVKYNSIESVFKGFVDQIKSEGFKVFVETPDCFTVRAKFPKGHAHEGLDADFVLARKETLANDVLFDEKMYELEILLKDDSKEELEFFRAMFHEMLSIFTQPFHVETFDFSDAVFFNKISEYFQRLKGYFDLKAFNK